MGTVLRIWRSPPAACWLLPLLLFAAVFAAGPAQAQDTTRTPADTLRSDTLRAPADTTTTASDTLRRPQQQTLSEAAAVGFETPRPGRAVTGRLPVRQPALDATEILAQVPGAFHYDFGAVGWPHGVSFGGRPSSQTALTLDGLPFDDPLTGQPRYDLLPLPFIEPLHVQANAGSAALGASGAVSASLRPYDFGRPLTELRYRASGLQSIGALHTQRRQVRFFGQPALAQFTGGYFGRASDNSDLLPGSELRRERRLLGRARYRRRGWALQLTALHNRRRLGANGGVALPEGAPVDSVFAADREVRFPDAQRRLIRTDLAATLRLRTGLDKVFSAAPLTATAYWTAQTFRYRNPDLAASLGAETTEADTLAADTDRYGLRLSQRFATERLGGHNLRLEAHAWADQFSEGNALPGGDARTWLHLSARDSTRLLGSRLTLSAGVHAGPVQTYPSASARLERPLAGGARLFAEARLAGQSASWIAEKGFGSLVEPLPDGQVPGRVLSAEAGARARLGPVRVRLALFANRTTDRLYLRATDQAATVRAALAGGVSQRTGASLSARWRADAERGFYATADATAFLSASGAPHSLAAPTVPRLHGRSRLGARYAFFTGDLDVDAYAEGRFWSAMTSRTLHTPTGRLALPPPGAPVLGPAGVLDLHAEATIRTATLFFSYENALSGTQVQRGVLNVPFYPLPAQRFRFGVYWPIFN